MGSRFFSGLCGFLMLSFLVGIALALSGCDLRMERPLVERIRKRGGLVVLTRNAPTTYYEGRDQHIQGFEHDLAVNFAAYLGVTAHFKVFHNTTEILGAIERGEGDLAAAGLMRSDQLKDRFRFGPVYQEVDQQVVCRRGGRRPSNLLQLAKVQLTVGQGEMALERLSELQGIIPNLTWTVAPDLSVEQVLEQVWQSKTDCTVADSNIVAINRRFYPELVVKFPIGATRSLSWVLPKRALLLQRELTLWFRKIKESGRLDTLFERYYGHINYHHEDYDYVDNRRFMIKMVKNLPLYEKTFRKAGKRYQTPWKLLAAQSYQESHWDPKATSFTGVRGMMMLTQTTAKGLGVKNRLDPIESILAGAWYLADLRRRLPQSIKGPDRTWFALAAYNVGMTHIIDARKLAIKMGKNPDLWRHLQTVLPLLAREKYYKTLKGGYARGSEPVGYVRNIRHYYDLLEKRSLAVAR